MAMSEENLIYDPETGMVTGVQKRNNTYIVAVSGMYIGSYKTVEEANEVATRVRLGLHKEFAPERRNV